MLIADTLVDYVHDFAYVIRMMCILSFICLSYVTKNGMPLVANMLPQLVMFASQVISAPMIFAVLFGN